MALKKVLDMLCGLFIMGSVLNVTGRSSMPTYPYECTSCGHAFEVFQQITAKPLRKCLECGGKLKRIIAGGGAIIFKGSGFYCNDSKKPACRTNNPNDKITKLD